MTGMKKIIFLFSFAVVLSSVSHSQEKYVEVVVTDTLLADPQEWTVYLNIEKQYPQMMIDTVPMTQVTTDPRKEPEGTSVDDVRALIKKYDGEEIAAPLIQVTVPKYYQNDSDAGLIARFSSRKSMEDFLKAIKQLNDVQAQVVSGNAKDLEGLRASLDAKLISRARLEANRLAQLNGRELGNVLSISDTTESEASSFKQFLEMIFQMESRSEMSRTLLNTFPDKIKLEKSLKVRYALK
jgi:hypothetical protein